VTIPKAIRDELGLKPGVSVEFVREDGRVILRRRSIPPEIFKKWRGILKDRLPNAAAVDEYLEEMRGPRIKLDPEPPSDL